MSLYLCVLMLSQLSLVCNIRSGVWTPKHELTTKHLASPCECEYPGLCSYSGLIRSTRQASDGCFQKCKTWAKDVKRVRVATSTRVIVAGVHEISKQPCTVLRAFASPASQLTKPRKGETRKEQRDT